MLLPEEGRLWVISYLRAMRCSLAERCFLPLHRLQKKQMDRTKTSRKTTTTIPAITPGVSSVLQVCKKMPEHKRFSTSLRLLYLCRGGHAWSHVYVQLYIGMTMVQRMTAKLLPSLLDLNEAELGMTLKPLLHCFFWWRWGRGTQNYLRWIFLKLIYYQQANT